MQLVLDIKDTGQLPVEDVIALLDHLEALKKRLDKGSGVPDTSHLHVFNCGVEGHAQRLALRAARSRPTCSS